MRPTTTHTLTEIRAELIRMDAKLDVVINVLADRSTSLAVPATTRAPTRRAADANPNSTTELDAVKFFGRFTPKQNAVLQMLMGGTGNEEIAHRLGVALNTAKVHVRLIARKLGVNTRSQVAVAAMPFFNVISADAYRNATLGLPKEWHQTYGSPDPYIHIYAKV